MNHSSSLKKVAFSATVHCLTGCSIGEVLGMVAGNYFGLHGLITIALSVGLAFVFGYALSLLPLVRSGMTIAAALPLALAADTVSITVMEIVDNLVMYLIPGAMDAALTSFHFWGAMAIALVAAFWAAYPVNMYLISRGKGHAVMHEHHH